MNTKIIFNIKAEMNLFREDRILREKKMENIKHKEMTVPGVAFYSADRVAKQSLRCTQQWMSTRFSGRRSESHKTSPLPQNL